MTLRKLYGILKHTMDFFSGDLFEMGKIFVVMGKTSCGKDTIFKRLMGQVSVPLKTVVIYTTRPMRPGEKNGVEYFFVTEEELQSLREQDKVIEERCYHTVHGPWFYFTVNDGQIDLAQQDYLMISTLAGYEKIRSYYKEENVIPIYIEADAKERLTRYIQRESKQKNPNYCEVCRRFLADESDFSEEELTRLGITKRYFNQVLEVCTGEIKKDMEALLERGQ